MCRPASVSNSYDPNRYLKREHGMLIDAVCRDPIKGSGARRPPGLQCGHPETRSGFLIATCSCGGDLGLRDEGHSRALPPDLRLRAGRKHRSRTSSTGTRSPIMIVRFEELAEAE